MQNPTVIHGRVEIAADRVAVWGELKQVDKIGKRSFLVIELRLDPGPIQPNHLVDERHLFPRAFLPWPWWGRRWYDGKLTRWHSPQGWTISSVPKEAGSGLKIPHVAEYCILETANGSTLHVKLNYSVEGTWFNRFYQWLLLPFIWIVVQLALRQIKADVEQWKYRWWNLPSNVLFLCRQLRAG